MGSKSSTPKAPDYSAIANASSAASDKAYALGQDQLNWAKATYLADKQTTDKVVQQALDTQSVNNANAAEDRARYKSTYQPLEDQAVADAESYNNPARREQDMSRAMATTAQQFDGQRVAAQQQLESFGIDPSSTRYAALDIGTRAAQAAAQAAAGNQAGLASDATGRALRADAINVGRGLPGQVASSYNTAINAGNQATSSTLATTASGSSSMNGAQGWYGVGNQAAGNSINALNSGFSNQLGSYNAQQNSSSGLGSLAGAAIGAGLAAYSLETGGAIPAGPDAAPGQAVPVSASPSRGAAIDDVNARLTPGEFVTPEDVVHWKGEEFFQKTIQQARAAKQQAQARPAIGPAMNSPITFASRPGAAAAIPAG